MPRSSCTTRQHDNLGSIEAKLHDLVDATGQKIDHLAIVSHGDPGLLKLTSTDVFTALVESNPGPWQTLGTLLSKDARIDFYGCDIGQGIGRLALCKFCGEHHRPYRLGQRQHYGEYRGRGLATWKCTAARAQCLT